MVDVWVGEGLKGAPAGGNTKGVSESTSVSFYRGDGAGAEKGHVPTPSTRQVCRVRVSGRGWREPGRKVPTEDSSGDQRNDWVVKGLT